MIDHAMHGAGSAGHSGHSSDAGHSGHAGHSSDVSDVGHSGHGSTVLDAGAPTLGVTSAQDGYLLTPVAAPAAVDHSGVLSFQILDPQGEAVTAFGMSHERTMHVIVVRADGAAFRHVHPVMDDDGTWSLPWTWTAAGTYRVYADFVLATDGRALTVTQTVHVAGELVPQRAEPRSTVVIDGFTVDLRGELVAGVDSNLTFSVSKDGAPVTSLQPYLGAFGHLVALRDGDLAFLHVHPSGHGPAAGEVSGPQVRFAVKAPTPGTYFLYLDFQVDGGVHSAALVARAHP